MLSDFKSKKSNIEIKAKVAITKIILSHFFIMHDMNNAVIMLKKENF